MRGGGGGGVDFRTGNGTSLWGGGGSFENRKWDFTVGGGGG